MSGLAAVMAQISRIQAQLATSGPVFPATGSAADFADVLSAEATAASGAASTGTFGSGLAGASGLAGVTEADMALAAGGAGPYAGTAAAYSGAISSLVGASRTSPGSAGGAAIAADAQRYLGVPYQWGGTDPASGLDCSGLVQRVCADVGIAVPRTSEQQATTGVAVANLAEAQPGDLVFFAGSDGTPDAPGHVGIYLGDGQMIDAPHTGTSVQVQDVGTPVAIRRVTGWSDSGVEGVTAGTWSPANLSAPTDRPAALGLGQYTGDFLDAGATYGVPPSLLAAVARTESSLDPTAVSGAGAEGLMQLMPSTAASLGVDPMDPGQAIEGAARLLSGDYQRFGSWSLALAAYNAGAGAVEAAGGIPPYPETQQYVTKVLATAGMTVVAGS